MLVLLELFVVTEVLLRFCVLECVGFLTELLLFAEVILVLLFTR